MKSVYCAVPTGSLNKAVCASSLKGIYQLKSVGNDIERGKFTLGPLLHRTRYKPNTCCVPLFLYSNYTERQADRRMFQKGARNIVSHGSLRDKTSVTSSQNYHCRSYRIRLSFERIILQVHSNETLTLSRHKSKTNEVAVSA